MLNSDRPAALRDACPACGSKGKPVKPITIESLVVDEARVRAGRADGFRFCAEPTCEVVYFQPETCVRIARSEVRVRIGQKETLAPRPICYCFGHTIEAIEADVRATGTSKVADEITEKCRQGLDRCEETNPQGSCCLGNVRRAIGETQARRSGESTAEVDAKSEAPAEGCCVAASARTTTTARPRSASVWATSGAVVTAILSSACCWLPLVLITFGASAASVAGFFETYRSYFLGASGLLLGSGFYLTYYRKERCGPGEACAVPGPRLRRFHKITLCVATIVVFAFALFPTYIGLLLGGGGPHAAEVVHGEDGTHEFRIEGMTCEACANGLQTRLAGLTGVEAAKVNYDAAIATVRLGPHGSLEDVLTAVAFSLEPCRRQDERWLCGPVSRVGNVLSRSGQEWGMILISIQERVALDSDYRQGSRTVGRGDSTGAVSAWFWLP